MPAARRPSSWHWWRHGGGQSGAPAPAWRAVAHCAPPGPFEAAESPGRPCPVRVGPPRQPRLVARCATARPRTTAWPLMTGPHRVSGGAATWKACSMPDARVAPLCRTL
eukprot:351083-Chlamydomonas_euryale.AAC.7